METYFNDLKNQKTLAPLNESEHLTELYQSKNLSQKDANLLAQISKSSISSLESTIGSLQHLLSNLSVYKECLIDGINLQAESADLITKYSREIPQQSHTLPGIVTLPQSYDLESIKVDNDRMEQVKALKDKAIKQKEIYLRLSEEDVRIFLGSWKRLNYANASFDEFCESLNAEMNESY